MKGLLPLALLGLLAAGCDRRPPIPPDQNTPQHQACRRESLLAPEVRALDRQVNPSTAFVGGRIERDQFVAANRAYRDCLRREGLALPGGVETVMPRDIGTDPLLWR
ncbi:MAG: phosphoribosylamine--glycine ligase [Acetobacteraceae bacterium]|nr:phosphoribosylamine--glycine ligase [Acetobacteraceae bacterium]